MLTNLRSQACAHDLRGQARALVNQQAKRSNRKHRPGVKRRGDKECNFVHDR